MEALAAHPAHVLWAYDEYQQEFHEIQTIIYGAQGVRVPPRRIATSPRRLVGAQWAAFVQTHNTQYAARQRAARHRAGGRKAE